MCKDYNKMSKIKIKNFGPIKSGFKENNGYIDISKVTIFIGNQGAGKSTVTKLISTMTWLEKALIRGDLKEKDLTVSNRFKKKHCGYQNIQNYFIDNTEIEFKGKAYSFSYKNGNFKVLKNPTNNYQVPKIMYVPAERNFVSAVDKPNLLKNLPNTLYTFLDEFENSKQELKENISLPVSKVKFEYQKFNKISWIIGSDYKIRLSEASSGFQSFVPLFLVTRYLSLAINKEYDTSKKGLSVEEEKRIKQEIESILSNKNLTEDIKKASLEVLSSKFKNSCFINIVEEPEQNLYPTSQKDILFKLFEFTNSNAGNGLIITTHSPYIISYLTLAVKGYSVLQKLKKSTNAETLRNKLESIIQSKACINAEDASVYEISENGIINRLRTYDGLPSDDNFLNKLLAQSNLLFDEFLEIEELCQ